MQNNGESVLPPQSSSKEETSINQYNLIKKENEQLLLENEMLKETLQKEKFYHQNLYKQWNELNTSVIDKDRELKQLRSAQNPKLKVYQYAFYGLLLLTVLLIVSRFYPFTNKEGKNSGTTQISLPGKKDTASQDTSSAAGQNLPAHSNDENLAKANSTKNSTKVDEGPLPVTAGTILPGTKNPVKYLIKQKSYFYNKPDNNTQRNTFVLPWDDAYGILTALDDRNGFIYVVFTNHKGRVSKGWISKNDLELLK